MGGDSSSGAHRRRRNRHSCRDRAVAVMVPVIVVPTVVVPVVVVPAINAIGQIPVIAVVVEGIGVISDTPVSRGECGPGRAGVGLRGSRSSKCSYGQPNASSQKDHFARQFAARHRSLHHQLNSFEFIVRRGR